MNLLWPLTDTDTKILQPEFGSSQLKACWGINNRRITSYNTYFFLLLLILLKVCNTNNWQLVKTWSDRQQIINIAAACPVFSCPLFNMLICHRSNLNCAALINNVQTAASNYQLSRDRVNKISGSYDSKLAHNQHLAMVYTYTSQTAHLYPVCNLPGVTWNSGNFMHRIQAKMTQFN